MKKLTAVLIAACALTLAAASPAFAQKDPFEPLVDPNAGTGTVPDTSTDTTDTTDPVFQQNGSDALPNSGGDPSPWLVLAYGLMAAGAAALVLGKIAGPQYLVARRR